MKLPLCVAAAAALLAPAALSQVTVDRFVDAADLSLMSAPPDGELVVFYRIQWSSQSTVSQDVSTDVVGLVNNQVVTATTHPLTHLGGGGQTCGGSCAVPDCSQFGAASTCHDFSVIPGAAGCQCTRVVFGSLLLSPAPAPGDVVSVQVAAAPGAEPELYSPNDRASIVVPEFYPNHCNGDGGNQAGCTDCPCANDATAGSVGGCLNSSGGSARLAATGSPSVTLAPGSELDLRFELTGAPPNSLCVLTSADALAPLTPSNPCFGLDSGTQSSSFDGLRCAVSNTRRHGGRSSFANGDVGVTFANPWGGEGAPPSGLAVAGGGFVAGQTRYFQVVHRDDPQLSCMRGLNTSQAVEATFTP